MITSSTQVAATPWHELVGHCVVLDLASPYVCIGTLEEETGGFLRLRDVDLHDLRDTSTTRERYIVDTCRHGVRVNRQQTLVSLREVVAITRLMDFVAP